MIDLSIDNLVQMNLLPQNLIILVVATMGLGMYFKYVDFIKDKYIITLLLAFSIIFSMILTESISATSFLQGIICWMASTTLYNLYKQTKKDE